MTRAEAFRRELLAHCYRMMGSVDDAEDIVQETFLRAWRASDRFEGRSSLRTWLYRIATNVCLTALRKHDRRMLPSGLGAPSTDPDDDLPAAGDVSWIQPMPDALVRSDTDDPAEIAVSRAGIRLALVAGLQHLSPRQRAVLVLRDVLGWPAAEVAEALDLTTGAVKSLLQRARGRLDAVAPRMDDVIEPDDPRARALLDQYMKAFEDADPAAFERALRADASIELPPSRTWFAGRETCVPYLVRHVVGTPGTWRALDTSANGQPALAVYYRVGDGSYQGFGIGVLTVTGSGIAKVSVFGGIDVLARFDLPPVLPG